MRFLLFIFSILAFAYAFIISVVSKSAIHEIEAGVYFLIATFFLCSAAIVDAIVFARKESLALMERMNKNLIAGPAEKPNGVPPREHC